VAKIYGQKIPLKILANAWQNRRLHHSVLLYGPEQSGKLETILNLAKTMHCKKSSKGFCDRCSSCRDIHLLRSPSVLLTATDDRMTNIKNYITLIKKNISSAANKLKYYLSGELANILNRHKFGFLKRVSSEKKSFPAGIKLTDKKLENSLEEIYNVYHNFLKSGNINLFSENVINKLQSLQDTLDRSILTADGIKKMTAMIKKTPVTRRIIIIQNIHLINSNIAAFLLKLLEEPPPGNYFFLTADNPADIAPAVITPLQSRCMELKFNKLNPGLITRICREKFGIKQDFTPAATITETLKAVTDSGIQKNKNNDQDLLEIFSKKDYNFYQFEDKVNKNNYTLGNLIQMQMEKIQKYINEKYNSLTAGHTVAEHNDIYRLHRLQKAVQQISYLKNNTNVADKTLLTRLYLLKKQFV